MGDHWQDLIIQAPDLVKYNQYTEVFDVNDKEVLQDIRNYITEHPYNHNIPVDFFIFLCKKKPAGQIIKELTNVIKSYDEYSQQKCQKELFVYISKNNVEDVLRDFVLQLNESSLSSGVYNMIEAILQYGYLKKVNTRDKVTLNNELKKERSQSEHSELLNNLVNMVAGEAEIIIRTIQDNKHLKTLQHYIEMEINHESDIGNVLMDRFPNDFKQKKYDLKKMETLNHFQIKKELNKLDREEYTKVEGYVMSAPNSKIWEVLPFIPFASEDMSEQGILRITQRIKSGESLHTLLNLMNEASPFIQEKILNLLIGQNHPDWRAFLSKVRPSKALQLAPYNIPVFLSCALGEEEVAAYIARVTLDSENEEVQGRLFEFIKPLTGSGLSNLLSFLISIQFTWDSQYQEHIAEKFLSKPSQKTEALFYYLLNEHPTIFIDQWGRLPQIYQEKALPILLEMDQYFLQRLQNDVGSLSAYQELLHLFRAAGIQEEALSISELFQLLVQEFHIVKEINERRAWVGFFEVTQDLEMTSALWTNTFFWLQIGPKTIEQMFEVAIDVYGSEEAAELHLQIYRIMKSVQEVIATDLLEVMNSLSIRNPNRYSKNILEGLDRDEQEIFFNRILTQSAAYYGQIQALRKESDKYLYRMATTISEKLKSIEILIAEKHHHPAFDELMGMLPHYLAEFWEGLEELKIFYVEHPEHLGENVLFDPKKHKGTDFEPEPGENVIVKTVGIKIGEEVKELALVSATQR
ncbi:hypothetical protein [Pontibacillus salipaludis]|uniref:hypothetical protein n=1 Tax=Pontibacillus salipaludis TaxID=1697394 RepID=UPI0031EADDDE